MIRNRIDKRMGRTWRMLWNGGRCGGCRRQWNKYNLEDKGRVMWRQGLVGRTGAGDGEGTLERSSERLSKEEVFIWLNRIDNHL